MALWCNSMPSNVNPPSGDIPLSVTGRPDPIQLNQSLPPSKAPWADFATFYAFAATQPISWIYDLYQKNSIAQEAPAVGGGYQPFVATDLAHQIPDQWIARAYMGLREAYFVANDAPSSATQEGTNVPTTVMTLMTPNARTPGQTTIEQGARENQGVIPGVTPGIGGVAPQVKPA